MTSPKTLACARRSSCNNFCLLALFLILAIAPSARGALPETPTIPWLRQFGTGGQDVGEGIATDAMGNVYVAGTVGGNFAAPFAGGFSDAFLRKYDPSGAVVWSRQFGTSDDEQATSVSVDTSGNIFVSGWTRGSLNNSNAGAEDAFLRKYDLLGNDLWTRQLGTRGNDVAFGVSADAAGNSYITGYTTSSLALPNSDGDDMFVAKYDPAGSLAWTRQYSAKSEQIGYGVAADASGNVYVTGYQGQTNIGAVVDPFLIKYDSSGNQAWSRLLGNTGRAVSRGVAIDVFGHVNIAGPTSANLGGGPILGGSDAFAAQYDASGNLLWVSQLGSTMNENTLGISTDGVGNLYIAGYTEGNLAGSNAGINDDFIAKFSSGGSLRYVAQIGTSESDQAYAVAADLAGNAYITGYAVGSLQGAVPINGLDAYVVKFTSVPEPILGAIAIEIAAIAIAFWRPRRAHSSS